MTRTTGPAPRSAVLLAAGTYSLPAADFDSLLAEGHVLVGWLPFATRPRLGDDVVIHERVLGALTGRTAGARVFREYMTPHLELRLRLRWHTDAEGALCLAP